MAPRTIFPIVDLALGGQLEARLRAWREEPKTSYDEIANTIRAEGVDLNGETVRRWCIDLGIEPDPSGEAA